MTLAAEAAAVRRANDHAVGAERQHDQPDARPRQRVGRRSDRARRSARSPRRRWRAPALSRAGRRAPPAPPPARSAIGAVAGCSRARSGGRSASALARACIVSDRSAGSDSVLEVISSADAALTASSSSSVGDPGQRRRRRRIQAVLGLTGLVERDERQLRRLAGARAQERDIDPLVAQPLAQPSAPAIVADGARDRDRRARPGGEHGRVGGDAAEMRGEAIGVGERRSGPLADQVDDRLAQAQRRCDCHRVRESGRSSCAHPADVILAWSWPS